MKYLVVAMAVGATALAGGSAAQAADHAAKRSMQTGSTDISSRGRHHHWHGYRPHHGWNHGYYRPYARSYGYYPRSYGYYGGGPYGYYRGGPGVTFSFGSGGYRW